MSPRHCPCAARCLASSRSTRCSAWPKHPAPPRSRCSLLDSTMTRQSAPSTRAPTVARAQPRSGRQTTPACASDGGVSREAFDDGVSAAASARRRVLFSIRPSPSLPRPTTPLGLSASFCRALLSCAFPCLTRKTRCGWADAGQVPRCSSHPPPCKQHLTRQLRLFFFHVTQNSLMGFATIPVNSMQPGFRFIPLTVGCTIVGRMPQPD